MPYKNRAIYAPRNLSLQEKLDFYSIPEPNSGCMLWLGAVYPAGYGIIQWGQSFWAAHRLAWTHKHGPIPEGMFVCHKCDVPSCINPDHLFLGTHQENMDDKVRKGRQARGPLMGSAIRMSEKYRANTPRGERVSLAILTDDIVRAIRADPLSQVKAARKYGTTQANVSKIRLRLTWKHI